MSTTITRSRKNRALCARAEQLAQLELDYQFHESFLSRELEAEFLSEPPSETDGGRNSRLPREMPAHLARLCERKLLSVAEERHRFRRMNYAKYRADLLRRKLDGNKPIAQQVARIEKLLEIAASDRNEIVTANSRLVISIARKFSNELLTFEELLSDGIDSLMKAVEKFDFSRGFRFSTYATIAIRHTLLRVRQNWYRDRQRYVLGEELLGEATTARPEPEADEIQAMSEDQHGKLLSLIQKLSARDQYVLSRRFGLDGDGPAQTLQSLGEELGICKERVRQLEMRARAKILNLAKECELIPDQTA
jgi:RNA polymerase primary sigma factor